LALLLNGFALTITVTNYAVSSYLTFSPLPITGRYISVALSLGFHLPGVTWIYFPEEPGLSS
tara:strand:+ start:52 stop:237 length:186 start_codon:yes stop_codon:yes gene_type:complete